MVTTEHNEMIQVGGKCVLASSVRLIVAGLGLDFRTPKTRACWGRNIVIAGGKRLVSTCEPEANAANFEQWLAACPQAVGVMIDGTLRLPRIADESRDDPLDILSEALTAGKKELDRQILKAAAIGLMLMLAGISVACAVLIYSSAHPFARGLIEYAAGGAVLATAGIVAGAPGVILLPQRNRIARILAALRTSGSIPEHLLAKSIAFQA